MVVIFRDYNAFLDDLEEDPAYRQQVNIYLDKSKRIPVDINDQEDPNEPKITLEEMLDDLHLEDSEMIEVCD
jgi:nonsense-mediated mRNA decay protein 3